MPSNPLSLLGPLLPRTFIILLTPGEAALYRFGTGLTGKSVLRQEETFPMGDGDLARVMGEIRRQHHPSADDSWHLGLPMRQFTAVNFTLPRAAQSNLDQAVHYALMRHVPFDLSEAYIHYATRTRGEEISVGALLALKSQLGPTLEAISAAGVTLSGVLPSLALAAWLKGSDGVYVSGDDRGAEILSWKNSRVAFQAFADNGDSLAFFSRARAQLENMAGAPASPAFSFRLGLDARAVAQSLGSGDLSPVDEVMAGAGRHMALFPYKIDFVPQSVIQSRKRAFKVQAVAALLLILAILAYPAARLAGKKASLDRLEARIQAVRGDSSELAGLRVENQDRIKRLEKIAEYVKSRPDMSELLKELTEVLPPDSWLESFVYDKDKVVVTGQGASATTALEAMENSPLFSEVRFESEITKRGATEQFKIVARLQ